MYCSSGDSCEKAAYRIAVKYPAYFECEEDAQYGHIDIRDKHKLRQMITIDAGNILHQMTMIRIKTGKEDRELTVDEFIVRHCYDPDGQGYYAICDKNGNNRIFVRSDYRLELIGGCWSYKVWRRLLSADSLLFWYLEQVKREVQAWEKKTVMEIRHLYLPYIIMNTTLTYLDESIVKNAESVIEEYKKLHIKEYEEYSACKARKKSWYNGEENKGFYAVRDILQNAVNDIYRHEKELKACGMWKKAYAVKDMLIDMEYERDEFARLRQYDAPVEELWAFAKSSFGSEIEIDVPKIHKFANRLADKTFKSYGRLKKRFVSAAERGYCVNLLIGLICYVLENPEYERKTAVRVSRLLDVLMCPTFDSAYQEEAHELMLWCTSSENRYKNSVKYLTGRKGDFIGAFNYPAKPCGISIGFGNAVDKDLVMLRLKPVFDKEYNIE